VFFAKTFVPYAVKKMTFKQKIHSLFLQLVQDRLDVFKDMILALTEDSKNDAKGSAGDKHETALSMMHIEQEKLTRKLREALDQKAVLDRIDSEKATPKISLGSLVKANGIYLYLSVALPKINVESVNVISLSPQSPLGNKLMGNQVGFAFEINNTKYLIESVE
jgi:transcription elongation GreA/GreB family factor